MRAICLLILLSVLSCTSDPGVTISGDLQPGVAQEGTLQQKEAKSYRLKLDSNSFIFGYVDQLSVDVVVELKDAGGNLLQSFDQPSKGPEHFSFVIDKTGDYTLEVAPFEEEAGDYTILIKKVEPLARDPEKRVDQLMVFFSGDNPGASIGVVKDGKLTFAKAYGKANLTHDLDFELDMPTNIGSVSKQFTAMSVLLLEKQGKLSLDDDVRKHIPELPDLGEVVTVRNILNHTNGWREVYNLMPIRGWYGEDKLLKAEVLNVLQHQTELQAAPGEEYNYNNSAFIMAAEIVERLSGQDFPTFVQEHIFEPLEMNDSYVRSNPAEIIPRATQGYSNGETGYIESGDLDAAYGAGAIYTTPADLTKWLSNFESGQVGGKEVVEKLVTPGILNSGDTMTYALGIGVGAYKGLKRYAHTGADIAHRACLYYFPEIKGGVITLSNNASFSTAIANQITDIFFSGNLEQAEPEEEKENAEMVTVAEDILKHYTGKYLAEEMGLVIEYMLEDGNLVAHPTGQSPLPLEPISDTTFQYSGIDASVVFHSDADGNYTKATHTQGGSDLVLIKMPQFEPSPEALAEYSGRYFSEELETFYTLTVKDSVLTAQHRNLEDIELSPVKPDHFNGSIYFIGELAFERNASGAVAAFTVSNGRTKGVLFERQ